MDLINAYARRMKVRTSRASSQQWQHLTRSSTACSCTPTHVGADCTNTQQAAQLYLACLSNGSKERMIVPCRRCQLTVALHVQTDTPTLCYLGSMIHPVAGWLQRHAELRCSAVSRMINCEKQTRTWSYQAAVRNQRATPTTGASSHPHTAAASCAASHPTATLIHLSIDLQPTCLLLTLPANH